MSNPRKRKVVLSLSERMKVVERSEKGESCLSIAKALGVGKTQIQTIVVEKDSVRKRWECGENGERKTSKIRKTAMVDVDAGVYKFFCDLRRRNFPVTGFMLQEEALSLAMASGNHDFTASNGWLAKWLTRHNIRQAALSGEKAEVDEGTVSDWTRRLPSLCEGYEPENIFNADETGLYFRTLPSKTMGIKGQETPGIKLAKERITVLLCVSATGEKLKPFVIGKSAKPRCFQGIDIMNLGVTYANNKKAWMTSALFTDWLRKLNNKMAITGRKILLFIDNCSAHPLINLSHIKLALLPPNTTSRLQPCDAGIIQAVKLNYRKCLLRHLLYEMEQDKTATAQVRHRKIVFCVFLFGVVCFFMFQFF